MSGIDYFAIFVLIMIAASAILVFVLIATIPGQMAKQRGHPQADAINIGGWMGAIFGGIFWPFILVWAFTKPGAKSDTDNSNSTDNTTLDDLKAQNAALEAQLSELKTQIAKQKGAAQ